MVTLPDGGDGNPTPVSIHSATMKATTTARFSIGVMALLAGVGLALAGASLRRFAVVEDSMRPALGPGDWVVGRRFRRPPRRGDVVVYRHPARLGMYLVKRVVGLPGEWIEVRNGLLRVDGSVLVEPWAMGATTPDGAWHVGDDALFLLGDQRAASADDSRSTGPVRLADIEFKVVARYWPRSRARLF